MQTRPDSRGRGQVIIVAALVIAATFVGLALVLNSGIYAENLSSRETTDTEGALAFTLGTDEAVAEASERTNRNGSATAEEARATFNGTMDAWEAAQQRRGATQGIGIDVERTAHIGWRLEQNDSQTFSSTGGVSSDWTLAEGARGIAEFELEVTQGDLYTPTTKGEVSNSFRIEVNNSNDWHLYIFENNSDTVVYAGDPSDPDDLDALISDSCTASGSTTRIDLQNESIENNDCSALNFSDEIGSPVDVSFQNGDNVSGNYTLVVNGSDAAQTSNFHEPGSASEPTATAVVYSASYASHYGRSDLVHERNGTYMIRDETHAS